MEYLIKKYRESQLNKKLELIREIKVSKEKADPVLKASRQPVPSFWKYEVYANGALVTSIETVDPNLFD